MEYIYIELYVYVHTHRNRDDKNQSFKGNYTMEYYSSIKKNEIMPFAATWMELETLILSEVSQKEKDKYHMISHIWNLGHK